MVEGIERTPGIRPRPTLWRRLDGMARAAFPVACTLLMMMVAAAPLGLPGQAQFLPALTLASVWFWSLYRPASMPPAVVFPIGLLLDLLGYQPVGVGVLTLLATHGFAVRWRRALGRQGLALVWLAFVGVAAGAGALGWALTSLLTFRLLPPSGAALAWALAVATYPALAILFARAHNGLADPGRA
jgi:rod shape-determining protein MreD